MVLYLLLNHSVQVTGYKLNFVINYKCITELSPKNRTVSNYADYVTLDECIVSCYANICMSILLVLLCYLGLDVFIFLLFYHYITF